MSKKIAEHQPMEGITVFEVENKIDHLTYLPTWSRSTLHSPSG